MFMNSILALTDFSADGDKALVRAGQIARGHGAALRLMYIPSGQHPRCQDPDTQLALTAGAMAQQLGLVVRPVGAGDCSLDNILMHAENARLLVLPKRSDRGFFSSWLGGPEPIRLARHSKCPVLLVRGARRRRVRQIVVAVDFTPAAQHRAMFACLLDRDALIELFHAVSTAGENQLRRADLDRSVLLRYRANCIEHARDQLGRMTQSLYAHAMPVESAAHIGKPAEQLIARLTFTGADLVVVGKRRRHAAADWLLGSTAHELLAQSPCDVMVVPEDFELSATRAAVQRLEDPTQPQWPAWPAIGG